AGVDATTPGGLAQAEQALRGRARLGAGRGRAGPVLEIGDTRHQRLLAEEPGERADAAVELELGQGAGDVFRMAESDDAPGHRMTDLVHARADRGLDRAAALRVRETLPAAPDLHTESLGLVFRRCPTRQALIRSGRSM